MINLWNTIKGYKTYIIGSLALIYAVSGLLTGHVDASTAAELISTALLGMGLRHGISTTLLSAALSQVPVVKQTGQDLPVKNI